MKLEPAGFLLGLKSMDLGLSIWDRGVFFYVFELCNLEPSGFKYHNFRQRLLLWRHTNLLTLDALSAFFNGFIDDVMYPLSVAIFDQ